MMEYQTIMMISAAVSAVWFIILHIEIFHPEIMNDKTKKPRKTSTERRNRPL